MADVVKANTANEIKNGVVTTSTTPTGEHETYSSHTVRPDKPTITEIEDKYLDRFDEPDDV
jgi:hypothetical protein